MWTIGFDAGFDEETTAFVLAAVDPLHAAVLAYRRRHDRVGEKVGIFQMECPRRMLYRHRDSMLFQSIKLNGKWHMRLPTSKDVLMNFYTVRYPACFKPVSDFHGLQHRSSRIYADRPRNCNRLGGYEEFTIALNSRCDGILACVLVLVPRSFVTQCRSQD